MLQRDPKAALRPTLRPAALVAAVVLYALGIGVGIWAVSTGARGTGEFALDRTLAADRGPVLADVGRVINVVFGPVVGPIWLLLLCLVLWRTLGRGVALRAGLLTLAGWFSIEVFKMLFHRHRPPTAAVHALVVETQPDSFPSGHTAFTTALVAALFVALLGHRALRRIVLLAGIPLIVVVAASRLVVGAHYLADVVAAPLLATATIAAAVGLGLTGRRGDRPRV